jgi:hypothetical protein
VKANFSGFSFFPQDLSLDNCRLFPADSACALLRVAGCTPWCVAVKRRTGGRGIFIAQHAWELPVDMIFRGLLCFLVFLNCAIANA